MSSDTIIGGDGRFPPQANATGSYDGVPFNARDPGDGLFTHHQLQLLPTNVAGLRSRIKAAVAAQTDRNLNAYVLPGKHHRQIVARLRPRYFGGAAGQTGQVLMAMSDLEASPLPSRLRAALFGVAKSLPGVHASAGDVVAQGPVNSLTAVPEHVAAIAEPTGLQPPQLAITPRSGRPGTTFTIRLTTPATTARSHHAPALDANMFGPTGPGCIYWTSRPPVARIPPGRAATRAGTVTYTYQLSAGAIGRPAWCTGRYQLLISPIWQSQAPGQPDTMNQLSHAAAYFTIR